MLDFEVAHAAAHVPDDVVFLPVGPERFGQLVIGFVDHMQGCVIRALEAALVVRDQAVAALEQVVAVFAFGRAVVNGPKLAVAFFVAQVKVFAAQREHRSAVFVHQLGRQIGVGGHGAVVHDVGKKQQRVIFFAHPHDLAAHHGHPFVEHLFQVVRRDLRADDVARLDGRLDGADELVFVRLDAERHKVSANVGRDFVQRLLGELAGRLAPSDGFFVQKGQHIRTFHDGGFFGVDHRQEWRYRLAFVQRHLHVMQQLGEHGVTRVAVGVFGLEPDLAGLDVDQPFGVLLEAQGLDVSVLDVLFALSGLQLGVEAHVRPC